MSSCKQTQQIWNCLEGRRKAKKCSCDGMHKGRPGMPLAFGVRHTHTYYNSLPGASDCRRHLFQDPKIWLETASPDCQDLGWSLKKEATLRKCTQTLMLCTSGKHPKEGKTPQARGDKEACATHRDAAPHSQIVAQDQAVCGRETWWWDWWSNEKWHLLQHMDVLRWKDCALHAQINPHSKQRSTSWFTGQEVSVTAFYRYIPLKVCSLPFLQPYLMHSNISQQCLYSPDSPNSCLPHCST